MPVTPLDKIQQEYIPGHFPQRIWARHQHGYATTGVDRQLPQRYELAEGRITSFQRFKIDGSLNPFPDPIAVSVHTMRPFDEGWTSLLNAAYERFKDEAIGEGSQLGASFAEWEDSLGMITKRTTSIYRAYRELRRGNFRRFLNELRASPRKRHRSRVRNTADEVSDLWLEYHFGWSPLLGDIYGAAETMSEPLPSGYPVKGLTGRAGVDILGDQEASWTAVCCVGGGVIVTNPNLALAARMGLVNPAQIAWELVPFSFLADWCFDISSFIGSFSDFAGMEVFGDYRSGTAKYNWTIKSPPSGPFTGEYRAKQAFMVRLLGLPRPLPNWDIQANLGTSITRAATATALLIRTLNGGDK